MRDLDIRIKLKETYLRKYCEDANSKVVDELSVSYGEARVDIAVINGSMHGFEIKSEFDTLKRLPSQIEVYSKTFDFITVITSECHLQGVIDIIPYWCGIIVALNKKSSNGVKLKTLRQAKKNKEIDKISLAQLLWKNELINIIEGFGIKKGLNNKSKPFLWKLLAENTSTDQLSTLVRDHLKLRANWRSEIQSYENDGYLKLSSKL